MADSGALRQRRSKAHKSGDHSLCGSRCSMGRRGILTVLPPVPAAEIDAAAELRALASRLAAVHEAEPGNALVARELRMTLQALMPKDAGSVDADLTGLFRALQA